MTIHERDLFFETLELLRRVAGQMPELRDEGQNDVDDWIFSRLPFTVGDVDEIYFDRDVTVFAREAIEGPAPVCPTYDELEPFIGVVLTCVERQDKTLMVVADAPGKPVLLTNGIVPHWGPTLDSASVWASSPGTVSNPPLSASGPRTTACCTRSRRPDGRSYNVLNRFMYKTGVFLARMQPLHIAHLYLVEQALAECEEVWVVLGSANRKDMLRNPFTIEFRREMLTQALSEKGYSIEDLNRIHVFELPDWSLENDPNDTVTWGRYFYYNVVSRVQHKNFTMYYSDDSSIIRGWFDSEVGEHITLRLFDRTAVYLAAHPHRFWV